MFLFKKTVLLAKVETVEGTDAAPDATNAIYALNGNMVPMAGSTADRSRAWPTLGADAKAHVSTYQTLNFDVELAGSGTAGTPPLYGPLLRACGMSETITAATSAAYQPTSDAASYESASEYWNMDGRLHKLLGSRGTATLKLTANQIPMISFAISGLFGEASDTAIPAGIAATLKTFKDALPVNKVNTPAMTLGGYDIVLESLQLDLGNKVSFRDKPNAAYVAITDRTGAGQIQFELPTVAAKDFLSLAKANTLMPLQLIHGTAGGNIVQIDAPKVQLIQPTYTQVDNIAHMSAQLVLARDSGDDELVITVK